MGDILIFTLGPYLGRYFFLSNENVKFYYNLYKYHIAKAHQNRGVRPPQGPHTTVHATKWRRELTRRRPSRIG